MMQQQSRKSSEIKSRTNLWGMQSKKATTGGRGRGNSCAKDWHDATLGIWLFVCSSFSFCLFPSFCRFSLSFVFSSFLSFFSLFLLIIYPCCLYPWYCTFMVSAKLRKESWKDGEMKLHWKRDVGMPECKLIPPRNGPSVKLKNLMNCRSGVHWVYAVQTDKTDNPA